MSGHTPGPWSLAPRFQDKVDVVHAYPTKPGASSITIARVTVRQSWFSEQQANARLIAAAPELLAALESLVNAAYNIGGEHVIGLEQLEKAADAGHDAIAKATEPTP